MDTTKKFTVVTQFLTHDGTNDGIITNIKRKYVQDGKVIDTPSVTINGQTYDGLSDAFCNAQKDYFGETNDFKKLGGMAQMSRGLSDGMTLVMSIWDDHDVNMLWLDSDYPTDADPSQPGVGRGTCSRDSGKPDEVENQHPDAYVAFSNIKYGDIDSTYG